MRKAGTVCFIIENEKVLLARIQYPDGKFFWNGIGGVIDAEETPAQTVVREVAEDAYIAGRRRYTRRLNDCVT